MITRRFFLAAAPAYIAASKLEFGVPKLIRNDIWAIDGQLNYGITPYNWILREALNRQENFLIPRNRPSRGININQDVVYVEVVKTSDRRYFPR